MTCGFTMLSLFGKNCAGKTFGPQDDQMKSGTAVFFFYFQPNNRLRLLLLLRELCVVETFSPFQHINQPFRLGFNVKMPPACD